MDLGLNGAVAAVTGGSEGIGWAVAKALAAEGCRVAICARREDVLAQAAADLSEETGGEILAVPADVTSPEQAAEFIEKAAAHFGELNILVNNAGRSAAGLFEHVSDAAWQEDINLKVLGAVRCSRAALPHMRKAGWGRIINITHTGGKQPGPSSLPTSVSRAAGIALSKAMAKDCAQHNVLVNTIMVGSIKSMQSQRRWEAEGGRRSLPEFYAEAGANLPLTRYGEAEEVAAVVAFLVSKRASYVSGAIVAVDGAASEAI